MFPDVKITDLNLDLVKEYLRVDFTEDDTLITSMLYAAKSFIQNYLNRKFTDWTDVGTEIPSEFTIAALAIISHWYENRQVAADRNLTKNELPYVFAGLLDMHRYWVDETPPVDPPQDNSDIIFIDTEEV